MLFVSYQNGLYVDFFKPDGNKKQAIRDQHLTETSGSVVQKVSNRFAQRVLIQPS